MWFCFYTTLKFKPISYYTTLFMLVTIDIRGNFPRLNAEFKMAHLVKTS